MGCLAGTPAPIASWRILDHRGNAAVWVSGIGEGRYRFPRHRRAGQLGRGEVVFPTADAVPRWLRFLEPERRSGLRGGDGRLFALDALAAEPWQHSMSITWLRGLAGADEARVGTGSATTRMEVDACR
jgi:hypothetical protein